MRLLWPAHLIAFPPACWRCGRLLPWPGRQQPPPGHPYLCPDCHAGLPRLAPDAVEPVRGVDRIWAACRYASPLDDWVRAFKYHRRDALLHLLGRLLREARAGDAAPPDGPGADGIDAVLPVPLHPWRLWQRGFNQSLLLARAWRRAAAATGPVAPLAADVLVRHRYTPPQARMSAAQRHANVADAFSLHRRLRGSPRPLEGRRLLLVDDVATTGATLTACAGVLRAAGAARVEALVIARD